MFIVFIIQQMCWYLTLPMNMTFCGLKSYGIIIELLFNLNHRGLYRMLTITSCLSYLFSLYFIMKLNQINLETILVILQPLQKYASQHAKYFLQDIVLNICNYKLHQVFKFLF